VADSSSAPVATNECNAEGCEASGPPLTGYCGPHWRKLPAAAQRVVMFHGAASQQKPHDKKAAANAALAMRVAAVLIAFLERRWSQRHCMDQIADACHAATRAGVMHRDIDTTVRAIGWEQIVEGRNASEGRQLELGGASGGGKKR
jgi:hypothetical protein